MPLKAGHFSGKIPGQISMKINTLRAHAETAFGSGVLCWNNTFWTPSADS